MGCCGTKEESAKPAAKSTLVEVPEILPSPTTSETARLVHDPHLEKIANEVDFVKTLMQSSFVSSDNSIKEQFERCMNETTAEEVQRADATYYSEAEQAKIEKRIGVLNASAVSMKEDRQIRWQKGEVLGVGAFGKVFLALDVDTGQLLAVKQVTLGDQPNSRKFQEQLQALEQEISLLRPLQHENIVTYYGCDRDGDDLNIYLELVPGGSIASLLQKFGPFSENVVRNYTRQLLLGLEYLHANRIIHRDIKGGNLLVDSNGLVKLADFGASTRIQNFMTAVGELHSLKGTPYWMAPEVIKQTGHGRQADIWSVGCTVIEMLTGKPPWAEFTTQVSALFHIASSKDPPTMPPGSSPECQAFLLLCFKRDPKERPNATRLLQHEFIRATSTDLEATCGSVSSLPLTTETILERDETVDNPGAGAATSTEATRLKASAEYNPMEEPVEPASDSIAQASRGDVLSQESATTATPAYCAVKSVHDTRSVAHKLADEETIKKWLRSQADQTGKLSDSMLHTYQGLRTNKKKLVANGHRQYLASTIHGQTSTPAASANSSNFATISGGKDEASRAHAEAEPPLRASGLQLEEVPIKTIATENAQREAKAQLEKQERRASERLEKQKAFEAEQEAFRRQNSVGPPGSAWQTPSQPGVIEETNP